jgi:hypothetical protein
MMPVYFPFTFVDEAAASRVGAWFEQMALLVPAAGPTDRFLAPGLDPDGWRIIALPGDETTLEHLETDLRQWADLHSGADLVSLLADREDASPFAALPAVQRLRSDIQAGVRGRTAAALPDPLLTARVFLRLAAGLDRDRAAVREQIATLAGLEREMHAELRGQPSDAPLDLSASTDEDPGAFLTERRLAAWGRLALATGIQTQIFVTDSPAVITTLSDYLDPLEPLGHLMPDPAAPDRACERLSRAMAAALAAEARATAAGTNPPPPPGAG